MCRREEFLSPVDISLNLIESAYQNFFFSYFSTKTYGVGTRKNHLNEIVFSEHPKQMLKLMGKKKFPILHLKFLFKSKPVCTTM